MAEPAFQTFYEGLLKPSWTPPDWAFPVVWFSLWTLQAIAVVLILGADRGSKRLALALFAAQLVTGLAWQGVVFGPGRLAVSSYWLVGVTLLVLATIAAFAPISRLAAVLVAPTLLWMCVATALGWTLWRLNPSA